MRPGHTAETDTTLSVIISTQNRPRAFANVVAHLLTQTVAIRQLIVIDQSETDVSRPRLTRLVAGVPAERRPRLTYVWDRELNGAAAARNRGIDLAAEAIVVFVDDNMIPEPDTLQRLVEHYRSDPAVAAITPVITNYLPPLRARLLTALFQRGALRDDRQAIYRHWRRYGPGLVPVRILGSRMLSVRRAVLGSLRFDVRYRESSSGEDIDLSWSLAARGARLAIATDARVCHERRARPRVCDEEAELTTWAFLYHKHQPKTLANRLAFAWFVTGMIVTATAVALTWRSLVPLRSLGAGLANLRSD